MKVKYDAEADILIFILSLESMKIHYFADTDTLFIELSDRPSSNHKRYDLKIQF